MNLQDYLVNRLRGRVLRNEWLNERLIETDQERMLRELAETYHRECDAYDRQVCTGVKSPRSGDVLPANSEEYRMINKHACEVRKRLICEGESHGLTALQVEQAIRQHCKD